MAIRTADGTEVNAKSVLSVLSACIKTGDVITMICDGSDETEALEDLRQVIQEGLGEL